MQQGIAVSPMPQLQNYVSRDSPFGIMRTPSVQVLLEDMRFLFGFDQHGRPCLAPPAALLRASCSAAKQTKLLLKVTVNYCYGWLVCKYTAHMRTDPSQPNAKTKATTMD